MKSCGSLSNMRAREIDAVGTVDLIVSSNQGVGLAFLQAEYLGTLEVGLRVQNLSSPLKSRRTMYRSSPLLPDA